TDGYAGYHALPQEITVVGCLAHARRKFDEALNVITPNDRASSKAMKGRRFCDALFAIEDKLEKVAPGERTKKRREVAAPILLAFRGWLNSIHPAPKSAMGRAVAYTPEQWPWLTNYLKDRRLEISNNRAERCIKPFVMGRKNFLFANTPGGATTGAIIYSLPLTAKESGLDPYRHLTRLMTTAPALDLADAAQVEALTPEIVTDLCRTRGG
ncbi:MAG: transposase, partial [Lactococcus sp.]